MKTKRIAAGVVILAAVGLIIGKQAQSREASSRGESAVAADTKPATTTVVLIANLAEADEECGCGEIIRAVRTAAKKGVATKEIDTRTNKANAQKYAARVVPTVVVVDGAGKELRRYQGESEDAIKSLKADLDALATSAKKG